jgi:class 3 adenylate cyclase
MNKAMGGHNNMMRKACHAHAGHVLDQEGDSWTIAFHDAEDAVAFALQVGDIWGSMLHGHVRQTTMALPTRVELGEVVIPRGGLHHLGGVHRVDQLRQNHQNCSKC